MCKKLPKCEDQNWRTIFGAISQVLFELLFRRRIKTTDFAVKSMGATEKLAEAIKAPYLDLWNRMECDARECKPWAADMDVYFAEALAEEYLFMK